MSVKLKTGLNTMFCNNEHMQYFVTLPRTLSEGLVHSNIYGYFSYYWSIIIVNLL